jgi:hypothetical protein
MNYNFAPARCLLFFLCFLPWALAGGFTHLGYAGVAHLDPTRLAVVWPRLVMLFGIGAGCASFVDHHVGHMPPSNLRPLYVILGGILMGLALMLVLNVRNS